MKVAISASRGDINAAVDPRFGRCPYYVFIDTETNAAEIKQNESAMAGGGAGIQAAQSVVQRGANAVITGNMGPNAFQVFNAAGQQETAQNALQAAYDLVMARAENITDPTLRQTFLAGLAVNRKIVETYEAGG